MNFELTREGLQVYLASHYTTRGTQVLKPVSSVLIEAICVHFASQPKLMCLCEGVHLLNSLFLKTICKFSTVYFT